MTNLSIIRGLIKKMSAKAKRILRFSADGRIGEEFSEREAFQHYGFSSCPPEGAECLIVRNGQNTYMIASDDRRYRIALKDGEVAIYDNNNSIIHLQSDGKVLIESKTEIMIKSDKVTVNAEKATVNSGDIYLGLNTAAPTAGGVLIAPPNPVACPYGIPHGTASQTVKVAP
jgi:phage gp45-like